MSAAYVIGIIAAIAMALCFIVGFGIILWAQTRNLRRKLRRRRNA